MGGEKKVVLRNLGDFLRIKQQQEEEDTNNNTNITTHSGGGGGVTTTLHAAIINDIRDHDPPPLRIQSSRTLADIIRQESVHATTAEEDDKSSLNYKPIHAGGSTSDSMNNATAMTTNQSRTETRSLAMRLQNDDDDDDDEMEEQEQEQEQEERQTPPPPPPQPHARMSLMTLLAETDRQMDNVVEEESKGGAGGGGFHFNSCCVCMVRHKGAAFIPCGHTFCRMCSRELWLQRGNCPLCNHCILQILDIF